VLVVLALATATTVTLVSMHSWAGQVELVISDDRALLNLLAMMKQLAASFFPHWRLSYNKLFYLSLP